MSTTNIELSIVYPDNFSETFSVNAFDLQRILHEAKDDSRLYFRIGEKKFNKTDVSLIATSNRTIDWQ